ncbi:F0F1 ATP synthase subunit gamma [Alphaproteobacteria bacterium]|jgi:F-type H+-transporting ATPase subunit gamma|nr:F0F1 ATP synthase subunit gamma [Alphaproteobacteria bacterium]|tara:strand:+ start:895 stop:1770 length:876 start_codon:yes stop_codon:yes gene_type:complete
MPNLKDLKVRINSVKSTQKITSAMKMVAAAKLRRAQEYAEEARPYSARMDRMIAALAGKMSDVGGPKLLAGTGKDDCYLLVVMTADRGLCGGFNSTIVRASRKRIRQLQENGKQVKLLCVGRKGSDQLQRDWGNLITGSLEGITRGKIEFSTVADIGSRVISMFEAGEFDICSIIFNRFQSAMTQIVTERQIIPASIPEAQNEEETLGMYEYEPDETAILAELLPRNVSTQLFSALLENTASEHGARMTAMDSATRNAGDMIDKLTLTYNRTRQAFITKELIEIISGAEAL